jgi:ribonuclease-3
MSFRIPSILTGLKGAFRSRRNTDPNEDGFAELEGALGYKFKNRRLLRDALVHRSYLPELSPSERAAVKSNERTEFLGDAVLSLVVNHSLYVKYPDKSEGELTKIKSVIVSKNILAHYARKIRLGSHILLSENALRAGVDDADSVLADTLEAVFGALFLDGGFEAADSCISRIMLRDLNEIIYNEENVNFKSLLQEYIQALHKTFPHYRVLGTTGPDHDKQFDVEVSVGGRILGKGRGRTKKQAEQEAAKEAYKKLLNAGSDPS